MDLHYYPLDSQNCTVEIESCKYLYLLLSSSFALRRFSLEHIEPYIHLEHFRSDSISRRGYRIELLFAGNNLQNRASFEHDFAEGSTRPQNSTRSLITF